MGITDRSKKMAQTLRKFVHGWNEECDMKDHGSNRAELDAKDPRVYLDIAVGGEAAGRITIQLLTDKCPKTCDNFKKLCTGECEPVNANGELISLHYKSNAFHHILPGHAAQAGDIVSGDGRGGYSTYGPVFPDENFNVRHDRPGVVSMSNSGPNTNSSSFFITTKAQESLDGRHVAFGYVVDGMDVVKLIDASGSATGASKRQVLITDCGVVA